MRVDAQMVDAFLGKGKHRGRNAMRGAVGCHAVQHGIRDVAAPLTVLDHIIGTVRARQKGERRHHATVLLAYIATARSDIAFELLGRGRAYRPLRSIAMLAHKSAGCVIDCHDGGNVGIEGFSDDHAATSRLLVSL